MGALVTVFFNARPEGWAVIGLIVAALAYCLYRLRHIEDALGSEERALSDVRQAALEMGRLTDKSLEDIRSRISKHKSALRGDTASITAAPTPGPPPARPGPSQVDGGTLAAAVEAVWACRKLAAPDLEAVATLLAQREAGRLAGVRAFPNRLMLGGLLGTVIGLAGALTPLAAQMTQNKDATDAAALSLELNHMLRHMNQAFACTAWGIVGAVLSSAAITRVGGRQTRLLADIQEFAICEFAPAVLPRAQAAQLENIAAILRASQEFMEGIGNRMDSAAQEFGAAVEDAGAAMQRSLTRLNELAGGVSSTLATASENVRQAAEAMQTSVRELAEGTQELGESQHELQSAYAQLKELFETTRAQIDEHARRQLEGIATLQEQHLARLGELHASHLEESAALRAQIEEQSRRQLEGSATLQEQHLARLGELHASHLKEGAAFRADFGEQAKSMGESASAAATAVEKGAERFNEVRDAIRTAGLEANQSLRTSVEHLQASFGQLLADHRSEVVNLEARIRAIDTTLQQLAQRLHPANLPREEWAAVVTALQAAAGRLEAVQSDSWPRALEQGAAIQVAITQLATGLASLPPPQPAAPSPHVPPTPASSPEPPPTRRFRHWFGGR